MPLYKCVVRIVIYRSLSDNHAHWKRVCKMYVFSPVNIRQRNKTMSKITASKIPIKFNDHLSDIGWIQLKHYDLSKGIICCSTFNLDCHDFAAVCTHRWWDLTEVQLVLRVNKWFTITSLVINFFFLPTHKHTLRHILQSRGFFFRHSVLIGKTKVYILLQSAWMAPSACRTSGSGMLLRAPWFPVVHLPYSHPVRACSTVGFFC